ncbi:hypothetical protein A2635_05060 [Candidatus Peribacteria bacterium RIFCSPHIGHO2_01_FULL_51_9]|nr:MAG: hypothetical protein A2635_05060 [Candidatus Peribacteria bacterium RIFCSPHIGHO2_01_FULL_51_9]
MAKTRDPQGKLVLIIGPSGVGKSVILKALRERHPEFHFPRSATTRSRREGEGDDLYHFVSEQEFDQLQKKGEFLEWALIHSGPRYATMMDEIIPFIKHGKTVIREVDVQGFESIRHHTLFTGPKPLYPLQSIFILPENKQQLIDHIKTRAPISDDELQRRIASMEKELTYASLCNAEIVNREGSLEKAIGEVEQAILD